MFDLNPCVLCGNKVPALVEWDVIGGYQVLCDPNELSNCTLRSNFYENKVEAVDGWNTVDKFDGIWNPNIRANDESKRVIEMVLDLKRKKR